MKGGGAGIGKEALWLGGGGRWWVPLSVRILATRCWFRVASLVGEEDEEVT